jgi:kynurenine formamidase
VSAEVAKNPDFLLMPEHVTAWEEVNREIPAGAWVLLRTGWSKRTSAAAFLNVEADGPHSPGFHRTTSELLARDRDVLGWCGNGGDRRGAGGHLRPAFPNHATMHGAGSSGSRASPTGPAPRHRRRGDRGATQDREWKREPAQVLAIVPA